MKRNTKIVATIGPATSDKHSIRNLIQAGMNVARLNFSHGTYEDHADVIQHLRYFSERLGHPIAIMQDLQGPKIRTGKIEGGSINLTAGEKLILSCDEMVARRGRCCSNLPVTTYRRVVGAVSIIKNRPF